MRSGPLTGLRIVELAGVGPTPFAGMMLSDAGADIVRVDRLVEQSPGPDATSSWDFMGRGRQSVSVDLKSPEGVALVLRLVEQADGFMEGFRPGVTERLGLGPEVCLARRPELVYGRMTGWGQDGPLANMAGHDIDYLALSGALYPMGRKGEPPVPPLNLLADFGGGGMLLAFGMVAAIFHARHSGQGQVVDASMVEGSAALNTMTYSFQRLGWWSEERGANVLDTGSHFYETYETADGKYVAVGAIERGFYAQLVERLGLDLAELPDQMDRTQWPAMKERFAAIFRTRTRDEWAAVFEGTDCCAVPVLSPVEAPFHPHNVARGSFVEVAGHLVPAPTPRFSATPGSVAGPPPEPGRDTATALAAWGIPEAEVAELMAAGVVV